MLNVCSVLQLLSVRIKLERVYPLYTFQPDSWANVRDETRLYFTAQEAQDWLDELSELFCTLFAPPKVENNGNVLNEMLYFTAQEA